ncbi:flagellar hook-associated protein FlgL, partial [Vibrio alfacsensis]
YKVTFVDMGNQQFGYQLEQNNTVVAAGNFDPSQGIQFQGLNIQTKGQITPGDAIEIEPQKTFSVFDTFNDAVYWMDNDVADASASAQLHQV